MISEQETMEVQDKENLYLLKVKFVPNFECENDLIVKEYKDLFKKILPINKKFKSLEVGCNVGFWVRFFNKVFAYKTSAIDILESSLKLAKSCLKTNNVQDYKLIHKDIFKYNKKEYYDLVYSIGTFEHFEDPTKLFKKCNSLLRKKGYMIIEVPHFSFINRNIIRLLSKKNIMKTILTNIIWN